MDRRKSLKTLAVGTLSAGVLLDACKTADKKAEEAKLPEAPKVNEGGGAVGLDRQPEEIARYKEVTSTTFFTAEEMATITEREGEPVSAIPGPILEFQSPLFTKKELPSST